MNFLQRLTSKSAAPTDAYGSVSTLEENDTSSPHADSLQDADNFRFSNNSSTAPAVIIKDKLKGSPFSSALPPDTNASTPSKIKSSTNTSSTGSVFSSWSAAGQNTLASVIKNDSATTSKGSETEPTEGKLMEEININWNYVTPAEPRTNGNDQDDLTDEEKLKQTKKVLEEEVK